MKRVGAAFFVAAASSYAALKVGSSTPSFTAPNSKLSPLPPPTSSLPSHGRDDRESPSLSGQVPGFQGRDDGKDDRNMQGFNFFKRNSGCDCKIPGGLGCWHRIMSLHEIDQLVNQQGRIIVTLMGGVFDVTDFTGHPGGYGRLQMVAGQDLEPFWKIYTQHNREHIANHLDRYRIGQLSAADAEKQRLASVFPNPYLNDPEPSPDLLTNTRYPYNAEARLRQLTDSWITPIGKHFVRNHCSVPDIAPESYQLTVSGVGVRTTTFTLDDLKSKFPRVEIASVIQCNGNRREDFHYLKDDVPAFGPPHWVAGAIGNSRWAGVRVRDLFKAAGLDVDAVSLRRAELPPGATNVSLMGSDHDEVGNHYCCSIPIEKCIDPFGDTIVAYEMNGMPIPRQHGFPCRAIVPGHAGARNCKFLERITITPNPCQDAGNWKQYAVHAPDVTIAKLSEFEKHAADLKKDPVVQEMPVQSMITKPSAGETLAISGTPEAPTVKVQGLAWGGGGLGINRVDVSLDGGKNFTRANILPPEVSQRRGSVWSWTFFEKEIVIPPSLVCDLKRGKPVSLELTSKALNTAWNVQPPTPDVTYNPHGCCVNHWYRVPVTVDPRVRVNSMPAADPNEPFENKPSGGKFKSPFCHLDPPGTHYKPSTPEVVSIGTGTAASPSNK